MMTYTEVFETGPVATNGYLIANTSSGTAVVIDCPYQSVDLMLEAARTYDVRISDILLTHTHWDHTADCAALVHATGATVWVHPLDVYRLTDPMAHTIWPLPFTIVPVTPDKLLQHGDVIRVAGIALEVRHTPGHSEGSVCFVDHDVCQVYVGDTLFNGSIGRTDLPGGDFDQLAHSIRTQLYTLPPDYVANPGHGLFTVIGDEMQTNPFVQAGVEQ